LRSPEATRSDFPTPIRAGFFFSLEAMSITEQSKTGEAGRKTLVARADARANQLAPIVAEIQAAA